jgi:membrane protein
VGQVSPSAGLEARPAFIGFWWLSMWFLLGGRISWRRLYPCAVATGAFWLGMLAVFSVIFSGMVISYDQKNGSIGVVFGLMSFFIASGWCSSWARRWA